MFKLSNRKKLTFSTLLLLVAGLCLSTVISVFHIREIIVAERQLYLDFTLGKLNNWVDQNFKTITSLATTIAQNDELLTSNPKMQFYLSQAIKNKQLQYLAYGLETGFYTVDGWEIPDHYDPRTRPWYQASKLSRSAKIISPYKGFEADSTLYLSLTAPIIKNDLFLGVVTGDVTLDFMEKTLFNTSNITEGNAFLIDQGGHILMHKDRSIIGKHMADIDPLFSITSFANNEFDLTKAITGEEETYFISPLKNKNLFLVLVSNNSCIQDHLYKETLILLSQFLAIFILVTLGFYAYNKRLLLPIINSLERNKNTGLPNKKNFKQKAIQRYFEEETEGMLIIISINSFNHLTSAYTPSTILSLQNTLKQRILEILKANSLLGFFSESRFIAFMPDEHSTGDIEKLKILQQLSDKISEPYCIKDQELNCAFNIGASCFPSDSIKIEKLIDYSFSAMAGRGGLNSSTYNLYTPDINQESRERLLLSNALRKAVRDKEFTLVYQPHINSKNGQLVGIEALIRWYSTENECWIPPTVFIPIAEASDLIVEIGDFVIETAFKQIKNWHDKGVEFQKMSINLSPRQLLKPNFMERLRVLMKCYSVDANQIEFEITETAVLNNPDKCIDILNTLKSKGFAITMDDFGTGYSSLEYLKKMPLDKLKIDKIFINDLDKDERDGVIVKMVIAMANALGYQVLAEGVENKEQLEYLSSHGCDLIQGYYYSKPLTPSQFEIEFHHSCIS